MENGNSLERFAEEPQPNTAIEKRRSASQKINELGKILLGWGIIGSSFLPGIEAALARRGPEPNEEEKTEYIDPEIKRNEDNVRYLRSVYGEGIVAQISPDSNFFKAKVSADELPAFIYRGREEGATLRPDPEKDYDLSDEELRTVFIDSYPRGLVDSNINIIVLEPGRVDSLDTIRAAGGAGKALGMVRRNSYGSSEYLFENKLEAVMETHGHEVGHAIDMFRDVNHPVQKKIELFRKITEYCIHDTGSMVDSIVSNSQDLQHHVEEFWAEKVSLQFFQHPGALLRKSPELFNLINDWVKDVDPKYNAFAGARKRQEIVSLKRMARELKNLPAGLQHSLENIRQEFLNNYRTEQGKDAYGNYNHRMADVERVGQACQQFGLKSDGKRDLRIAYALWGSFDYQTRNDFRP